MKTHLFSHSIFSDFTVLFSIPAGSRPHCHIAWLLSFFLLPRIRLKGLAELGASLIEFFHDAVCL